jgi:hypothetical protein
MLARVVAIVRAVASATVYLVDEPDYTQVAAMQFGAVQACSGPLRSDACSTFALSVSVSTPLFMRWLGS